MWYTISSEDKPLSLKKRLAARPSHLARLEELKNHGRLLVAGPHPAIDNENPDGDIRVEFTGLRPGEKLYEELLIGNDVVQSEHPRIMQAKESKLTFDVVSICVKTIKSARENQDEKVVKELLLKYVDGYTSEVV